MPHWTLTWWLVPWATKKLDPLSPTPSLAMLVTLFGHLLLVTRSKTSFRDIKALRETYHKHHAIDNMGFYLQALGSDKH